MNDSKTWRVGHSLHEYINYNTNKKFVRVRYENEKEHKICAGACHRSKRQRAQNVSNVQVPLVSQKS